VILIGPSTDPYDPAAVKASMGALFDVPVAHTATAAEFLAWAGAGRVAVAAASARGSSSCWDAEFALPLAILLGSEGAGLPADVLDLVGEAPGGLQVRIPMAGTAESLNLSVASGVLLYEVRRRTGLPGRPAGAEPPGPDAPWT
jgi:TrmH family RNA methyltransferase